MWMSMPRRPPVGCRTVCIHSYNVDGGRPTAFHGAGSFFRRGVTLTRSVSEDGGVTSLTLRVSVDRCRWTGAVNGPGEGLRLLRLRGWFRRLRLRRWGRRAVLELLQLGLPLRRLDPLAGQ